MRTITAICPRVIDGVKCDAEQDVEVDSFWEGGWVFQFATPDQCPDGHVWTDEEKSQVTEQVTEFAADPPEPDVD